MAEKIVQSNKEVRGLPAKNKKRKQPVILGGSAKDGLDVCGAKVGISVRHGGSGEGRGRG